MYWTEINTIIKTDSSVRYDEEKGLSIENNFYESCHLDSIEKCETYGGFNPNWFCSDMPLPDAILMLRHFEL